MPTDRPSRLIEALTIVVSILLAFGIDAAWDWRQARGEEQEALAGLYREALANRRQVDQALAIHGARAASYEWFQSSSAQEIRSLSVDSAAHVYRNLYAPQSFDASRGSVDALIGAGKLNLIRDGRLREAIATFLNVIEDLEEERESMRTAALDVLRGTAMHGGPWNPRSDGGYESVLPPITAGELASLRDDAQMMGLIRLSYHWSSRYSGELAGVSVVIEEILALTQEAMRGQAGAT